MTCVYTVHVLHYIDVPLLKHTINDHLLPTRHVHDMHETITKLPILNSLKAIGMESPNGKSGSFTRRYTTDPFPFPLNTPHNRNVRLLGH